MKKKTKKKNKKTTKVTPGLVSELTFALPYRAPSLSSPLAELFPLGVQEPQLQYFPYYSPLKKGQEPLKKALTKGLQWKEMRNPWCPEILSQPLCEFCLTFHTISFGLVRGPSSTKQAQLNASEKKTALATSLKSLWINEEAERGISCCGLDLKRHKSALGSEGQAYQKVQQFNIV